jgi:aryl-alcohol dehydrogenase-like predicted oxidoreductase
MIERPLGRTGRTVSLLGMGTGGHDPLGAVSGRGEAEMVTLLCDAFDMGITLFDTSPGYADGRSEVLLGKALKQLPRDEVTVSTKIALTAVGAGPHGLVGPADIEPALRASLDRLQLDAVDVLLMAVADEEEIYGPVIDTLVPELLRLRDAGCFRALGSSELTRSDGAHSWLQRLMPENVVDVVMCGHNLINQSAQQAVLPRCRKDELGFINIFTVRSVFSSPTRLREVVRDLKARGIVPADADCGNDVLDWLTEPGVCESVIEAAYRYAGYTDGVSTVMCGTIERDELAQNVETINRGPLPDDWRARLAAIFSAVAEPIGN